MMCSSKTVYCKGVRKCLILVRIAHPKKSGGFCCSLVGRDPRASKIKIKLSKPCPLQLGLILELIGLENNNWEDKTRESLIF